MMSSSLLSLLLLLASAQSWKTPLHVGDPCSMSGGAAGVCTRLNACAWAVNEASLGRRADVCACVGPQRIVCCPAIAANNASGTANNATDTANNANTTTTTEQLNARTNMAAAALPLPPEERAVGRIARRMCEKYAAYVFVEEESPILIQAKNVVDKCVASSSALIVGGTRAEPMEFPHMASVGFDVDKSSEIAWLCGGSLVAPDFVLTAAHCLVIEGRPARWVRLGELDQSSEDDDRERPQVIKVARIWRHPDYAPPASYNDIGLLRLARNATLSGFVRPACLHTQPALRHRAEQQQQQQQQQGLSRTKQGLNRTQQVQNQDQEGRSRTWQGQGSSNDADEVPVATGWGHEESLGQGSDHLLKVSLNEMDHDACAARYKTSTKVPRGLLAESQLCAGRGDGKDTCQGDSGGPLQLATRNFSGASTEPYCMHKIVGVTSFGMLCGYAPGVYTRVYHFLPWIEGIVWGSTAT